MRQNVSTEHRTSAPIRSVHLADTTKNDELPSLQEWGYSDEELKNKYSTDVFGPNPVNNQQSLYGSKFDKNGSAAMFYNQMNKAKVYDGDNSNYLTDDYDVDRSSYYYNPRMDRYIKSLTAHRTRMSKGHLELNLVAVGNKQSNSTNADDSQPRFTRKDKEKWKEDPPHKPEAPTDVEDSDEEQRGTQVKIDEQAARTLQQEFDVAEKKRLADEYLEQWRAKKCEWEKCHEHVKTRALFKWKI